MPILNQHDPKHPDALMRPMQSWQARLRRAIWLICWFILCRFTPNPMHRWRCFVLKIFGAKIGKNNFIYPSARIWAPWLLETGEVATIGPRAFIYNVGGLSIGHHAIVSESAFICGATHDYQSPDFTLISQPIEIGAYAWIAAFAIVLPAVTCHEGSVLGAGAVTHKDLDAWTVYSGNPASSVSKRENTHKA